MSATTTAQPLASPVPASASLDFLAAWRDWLSGAADPRLAPERDLEFWRRAAPDYHLQEGSPARCPKTMEYVLSLLRSEDSFLDAGCGAGRFAIAAAGRCARVTALDFSPEMLEAAQRCAAAASIASITFQRADLGAPITRHDVVLAAWSLYRQLDLAATLENLIGATGRTLIIVAPDTSDGVELPAYLYVAGALRQLGYHAEVRIFDEATDAGPVPVPVVTWRRGDAA